MGQQQKQCCMNNRLFARNVKLNVKPKVGVLRGVAVQLMPEIPGSQNEKTTGADWLTQYFMGQGLRKQKLNKLQRTKNVTKQRELKVTSDFPDNLTLFCCEIATLWSKLEDSWRVGSGRLGLLHSYLSVAKKRCGERVEVTWEGE